MTNSHSGVSLNTNNLAGYTLANMPASRIAMGLLFKGAKLSFVNIKSSYSKESVAAFSYPGLDQPAFYLDPDGDSPQLHRAYVDMGNSGYAFSIFTFNPAVTVLGKYYVGETTLKNFEDPYFKEASLSESGDLIYCLSDNNAHYGYQLIFKLPETAQANINQITPELLGSAVLHEARFFVANRKLRKERILSSKAGLMMVAKAKLASKMGSSSKTKPESNVILSPVELLMAEQMNPNTLLASYDYVIENSLHKGNEDELKSFIKAALEKFPSENELFYFHRIIGFGDSNENFKGDSFVLIQDFSQDIRDTVHFITQMVGDRLSKKLPGEEVYGDKGIGLPGFLDDIQESLATDGLGYTILDNGSDQLLFLLFELDKKEAMGKHLDNILKY